MIDWNNLDALFDGSQRHPCVTAGCPHTVEYDDEPWCFTHSPDSGSSVPGYSYRKEHPVDTDND